MNVTLVELEFVELPDVPSGSDERGNYLLSMWDTSARIAGWNAKAGRFEDAGGRLNPLAIRSWAKLQNPIDHPGWGKTIVAAAIADDGSYKNAGWLEPKYEAI